VTPGKATTDTATTLSSAQVFTPHIDTFSGMFITKVGDGGYTSDSMRPSVVYVNHVTKDSVIVTGSAIYVTYYDDLMGSATYGTSDLYFSFVPDSSGRYYANPMRHCYNGISLVADSIYVSMASEPGSCLINELQTFAGKKR